MCLASRHEPGTKAGITRNMLGIGMNPEPRQESVSHPQFLIVGGGGAGDKPGARARQGREHARGTSTRGRDHAPGVLAPLACSRPWRIPCLPPRLRTMGGTLISALVPVSCLDARYILYLFEAFHNFSGGVPLFA